MTDPLIENLEQREKLFFARVFFVAKVITLTVFLAVLAVTEGALLFQVLKLEAKSLFSHAESEMAPADEIKIMQGCHCNRLPDKLPFESRQFETWREARRRRAR